MDNTTRMAGEEAELAAATAPKRRELGWARGEFTVPEDFDDPLPPEIENGFCR